MTDSTAVSKQVEKILKTPFNYLTKLSNITFISGEISYTDNSFAKRAITAAAQIDKIAETDVVNELITEMHKEFEADNNTSQHLNSFMRAVENFARQPVMIRLSSAPKNPIAITTLMRSRTAAEAFERLNVESSN